MYGTNIQTDETWKRIPEGSVGVEIGVWKGESSEKFLRRASKLHLVDPWSPMAYEDTDEFGDYNTYIHRYSKLVGSSDPKDFQKYYDKICNQVCEKFKDNNVVVHRCTSDEFFKNFQEEVDWIYLDGSHAYDQVSDDLCNSTRIVKRGGSIFGDDYSDKKPGVKKAVDDFCEILSSSGVAANLQVFGPGNKRWPDSQYEIKI